MRVSAIADKMPTINQDSTNLIKGEVPKLATNQIDNVEDINFKESKNNHRISFQYDKDLGRNIAHVIDNKTGETVKQLPSASQVDHMIRLSRLMGLHIDKLV